MSGGLTGVVGDAGVSDFWSGSSLLELVDQGGRLIAPWIEIGLLRRKRGVDRSSTSALNPKLPARDH